jgi:hypothetical protein
MKFKDVELLAANTKLSQPDKEKIRFQNATAIFRLA